MRRMAFGALLAAMLVGGPTFGAVAAEHRGMLSWQTGDNLFDMCLHEQGTEQLAFCIGYVVAVAAGASTARCGDPNTGPIRDHTPVG